MSKERARRREERERQAALLAQERAARAARRARWAARRDVLTGWLPQRPAGRPQGILAERRRRQTGTTVALVLSAVVLTWAFTTSVAAVALALAVGALAAPVLHTMLFRRT